VEGLPAVGNQEGLLGGKHLRLASEDIKNAWSGEPGFQEAGFAWKQVGVQCDQSGEFIQE
jgi:hypothetical protein